MREIINRYASYIAMVYIMVIVVVSTSMYRGMEIITQQTSFPVCEETSILLESNQSNDDKHVTNIKDSYEAKVQKALDNITISTVVKPPLFFSKKSLPKKKVKISKKAITKSSKFKELPKDSTIVYETLYNVKYNNAKRTVTYYRRDYVLSEVEGKVNYLTKDYHYTINSKATLAERKNNPGNITCVNGLRSKAFTILRRNAKDRGDAASCIYATVELGMKDYVNLLHSKSYNNAPIKIAFRKYQSDMASFKNKLNALSRAGININKRFKDLSKTKQLAFAAIYARYEGYRGLNKTKLVRSKVIIRRGVVNNNSNELNKELIASKKQVVLKIRS